MTNPRSPRSTVVRHALALLSTFAVLAAGCSKDPEAVKLQAMESGKKYMAEGKYADAVISYRNAVQARGNDGEARRQLAEALIAAGDVRAAAAEYIRAADLLPQDVDVQLKAGALLLAGARFDDARVRAQKALELKPESVEAHVLLANSLVGLKDIDGALAELDHAIKLAPDRSLTYTNIGNIENLRGKAIEAERAFKRGVELDARSVPGHLALANFYWTHNRLPEAEQALAQALKIEPNNVVAHRAMASLTYRLGREDETRKHLQIVVEVTKAPNAAIALADFYLTRRENGAAREVLEQIRPTPPEIAVKLAQIDYDEGKKDSAHSRLKAVLDNEPTNLGALTARTQILLAERKTDEAYADAQAAVKAHSEASTAHLALARVQEVRREREAAIKSYQQALALDPAAEGITAAIARLQLADGKTADAVSLAEDAVRAAPTDAAARLTLVRGLLAQGQLQRAEAELAKLSAQNPKSADVRTQAGLLYARKRDLARARTEFEGALAIAPQSVEALTGLVSVDLAEKRQDQALARVKPYAERTNTSPELLVVVARTHLATGDLTGAEQLLRRVLAQDPGVLEAYALLGQIFLRQKRADAALAEYDRAAARDPKPVAPLTAAAMILESQGRYDEARGRYERVLQIDPNAAVAANNLAWLLADRGGNLDLALQLAQTAYAKLPDNGDVADTLGYVYLKKNLLPQSVKVLRETVAKHPNGALYHYHLGLALEKSGDRPGAVRHLKLAISLNPNFPGAADARSVLQKLGASAS